MTAKEFWDQYVKDHGWGYSLIHQRIEEFAEAYADFKIAEAKNREMLHLLDETKNLIEDYTAGKPLC